MAREELEVRVVAQDDASKVLDKVAGTVDELEGEDVEIPVKADTDAAERDITSLMQKVDKLGAGDAANLLLTTNASQITNDIADLVIKLDTLDAEDPQVDITVANIAQLQGDLEQISAKAKEINDTPIQLDTSGATQGIDQIGRSADSSKSVLANMVGNATQDLGALGGVAGSVGVAIGQMGEYMADAAASGEKFGSIISNFGKVVGPIAVISGALAVIGKLQSNNAEAAELAADSVERWGTAMEGAGSAAANYAEALRDAGEVMLDLNKLSDEQTQVVDNAATSWHGLEGVFGLFKGRTEDVADIFDKANLSVRDFNESVTEGAAGQREWTEAVNASNISDSEKAKLLGLFTQEAANYAQAQADMARNEEIFGGATEDSAATLEKKTAALQAQAAALGATADMQAEAAQRVREQDAAYREVAAGMDEAIDAADALAAALEQVNAASELDFSLMALDTVDSFDAMKEAIKGTKDVAVDWATVDLTPDSVEELKGIPDELAAVTEGISGMRDTIQAELNAAFETGGIDAYTAKAEFFRAQVLEQFPAAFQAMGASSEEATAQATALADELGLMPEDIQIMIQLTRAEEAKAALEQFSSFIDTYLPPEVAVAIRTAIAEGDIEGALGRLNTELINKGYDPIVLPTDADTSGAADAIDDVVAQADSAEGTITVDSDTARAKAGISGVKDAKYDTTITADADTSRAADGLLDVTSRQRNATIYAVADANAADARLDSVANQARTATITADANTGNAARELDNLARPRSASINVTVHRTEVLTRVDGGG